MSSTYSSDLRIELIGTGDQAGVWGSTTNSNLGTLLESAIVGYTSVSVVSAAQAFTVLNGAPDQARFATIALSTTTTADFAVYAPPVPKPYVLYNTSAYNAAIYNSTVAGNTMAAGTGITIAAGKIMTVWSDGTNFYQQNTQLISSSLTGTPTAPTASYGTNTTQLSTTAFVQAAVQALYPIGSIYSSTVSTNPNTLFGFGTWTAYGAGRVLIGDGGGFSAGATGGSADAIVVSHTHTFSASATTGTESASHTHNISISDPGHSHSYKTNSALDSDNGPGPNTMASPTTQTTGTATTGITASAGTESATHTHSVSVSGTTDTSGSSGTNANLQPYVVVYIWNRTA